MRANISAWAIKKPIPSIVLFILLMFVGVISFLTLQINASPNVDFPIVTVTITQSGAAPSELETQVTRRVEDAVTNIGAIDHITSTVTDGVSRTTVQFILGTNTDRAVNDVRDAVSRIREVLPQTIDEPQVNRVDVAGGDVIAFSVADANMSPTQLGWFVDNEVTRQLLSIQGVGSVQRAGGAEREIQVTLDPQRLIALGITVDDVNRQIRDVNVNLAGGRATLGLAEQSIRAIGSVDTIDALKAMTIALSNHRKARLSDLGTVEDGFAEMRSSARLDGVPVVAFTVGRSPGASEVTVAKAVIAKVEKMRKDHPKMVFTQIFSVADYAEEAYHGSMDALMIGAALAIIVVFIFLRDWRATIIVGIAMPLSVFPTFFPLKALGFTLNWCSLLALTLVVGILVDDAIVEIENIVRHMRMGKKPYQAALDAADEIGLAVVATTMTIVAVFLPVSFMSGIAGQFFRQFGATVAIAVLFSLLVARLITPMMAAYLGRHHEPRGSGSPWVKRRYLGLLSWALDHRWKTLGAATVFFFGSMALLPFIPGDFVPAEDDALSNLSVELPPGSNLADSDRAMQQVSAILKRDKEVSSVFVQVGGQSNGEVRRATATINLVPLKNRSLRQQAWEALASQQLKAVPGIRYNFGGGGDGSLPIVLTGDDPVALTDVSDRLVREMQSVPGISNIQTSASLLRPELQIRPLYDRASELGVSVADISQTARLATLGEINANLAKFNLPDRQIPIRVEIDPAARADLNQIRNLRVATANGGTVPLDAVAEITLGSGTSEIKRYDRSRQVKITADLNGTPLGTANEAVHKLPAMQHLPPSVHLPGVGGVEAMQQVFTEFAFALLSGILIVLGVLVLLFQSFLQPITIMGALPLSIGGALIALMLTGYSLSLPVLIGLLMLMGIVTKNSILFVDYVILAMREHGMNRRDALIEAGDKRAQPIIMTTIAMVAGMFPLAARLTAGNDFQAPMAVTVIGGLVTSTLLSLIMIPVGFTVIDDIQRWVARRFGAWVTPEGEVQPHPAE